MLDQTLTEIRSGRRLEKIAGSIASFLNGQLVRLETVLEECDRAQRNDQIVQQILADLETQKIAWAENCQTESQRLKEAADQLALGWKQLENERRKWIDERDHRSMSISR